MQINRPSSRLKFYTSLLTCKLHIFFAIIKWPKCHRKVLCLVRSHIGVINDDSKRTNKNFSVFLDIMFIVIFVKITK